MSWILTILIALPVAGAVVLALSPRDKHQLTRVLATLFSAAALLLALYAYFSYDQAAGGLQLVDRAEWIPSVGVSYLLGADGLSLPLIVLTTLLTFLACIASWNVDFRVKEYFAYLLILEAGVIGVFSAGDLLLFFLFWEVEIIPMYLLIGIWGGPRREYAATKFVIYTLLGSALMLFGILLLYFNGPSPHTFEIAALGQHSFVPAVANLAFLLLLFGFSVKLPSFPFHTWLPDAHVEAPTAVSVILAGVLLKMGGYGLLRLNVGLLPDATRHFALLLAILAVVSVLYGAIVSMAQRDLKAMVAFSSISHMGYVMLGIAALNAISLNGAAIQMFTHGTITALLFLVVGSIYDRAHTRDIPALRGLAARMPIVATIFVIAGLASLGLPGLSGFIAEFTVFVGSFSTLGWATILAAFGIVITAGYILWTLQRVLFGPPDERWQNLGDVSFREAVPLVSLAVLIVLIGVYPAILTDLVGAGVAPLAAGIAGQ